jgi:HAD superfamily hydrolase (TIGR01459 family)
MQDLSRRYPVWFCDIWGVVHDGHTPNPATAGTLSRHRANGGIVILVTNSPRSNVGVEQQIAAIGVPRQTHDAIVTSGDVTRTLIEEHGGGQIFHLGPERDHSIFEGLEVRRVPLEEAKAVLCTGLFNDRTETPDDYHELLADMRERDLEMICANPDRIVRIGSRILFCAGSLADAYQALGGKVLMAGKPYEPIYELAQRKAQGAAGRAIAKSEILAIGDGPDTDIRGAAGYGIDAVLVADGITQAESGLEVLTRSVEERVPGVRIVKTLERLDWVSVE